MYVFGPSPVCPKLFLFLSMPLRALFLLAASVAVLTALPGALPEGACEVCVKVISRLQLESKGLEEVLSLFTFLQC